MLVDTRMGQVTAEYKMDRAEKAALVRAVKKPQPSRRRRPFKRPRLKPAFA